MENEQIHALEVEINRLQNYIMCEYAKETDWNYDKIQKWEEQIHDLEEEINEIKGGED